jgi:hypothetical protein
MSFVTRTVLRNSTRRVGTQPGVATNIPLGLHQSLSGFKLDRTDTRQKNHYLFSLEWRTEFMLFLSNWAVV